MRFSCGYEPILWSTGLLCRLISFRRNTLLPSYPLSYRHDWSASPIRFDVYDLPNFLCCSFRSSIQPCTTHQHSNSSGVNMSILKMEPACSSEALVCNQKATRRNETKAKMQNRMGYNLEIHIVHHCLVKRSSFTITNEGDWQMSVYNMNHLISTSMHIFTIRSGEIYNKMGVPVMKMKWDSSRICQRQTFIELHVKSQPGIVELKTKLKLITKPGRAIVSVYKSINIIHSFTIVSVGNVRLS